MFDPRDDARDRDGREDGRERVYDERDRDDDPREGLMRDLDLPRGEERELVVHRDRVHELDGEDSRTLAAVGAFRVVPEHDLDIDHDTLEHLRDEGLVETVDLGDDERGLTLTREGRDLLDSHSMDRDDEPSQAFYAGVSREREVDHDSNLYATYRQEEARLRDEHDGLEIRRVVLEQDLKREYQEFLQEHNRGRADSDGRPDRDEDEIREWAREHDLPYFDGQVHFPDYRIEYEVDGREHHQDVELFTEHYRGAHAASHAQTGFRIYVVGSRGGRRAVRAASARHGGVPVTHEYPTHDIYDSVTEARVNALGGFGFTAAAAGVPRDRDGPLRLLPGAAVLRVHRHGARPEQPRVHGPSRGARIRPCHRTGTGPARTAVPRPPQAALRSDWPGRQPEPAAADDRPHGRARDDPRCRAGRPALLVVEPR